MLYLTSSKESAGNLERILKERDKQIGNQLSGIHFFIQ